MLAAITFGGQSVGFLMLLSRDVGGLQALEHKSVGAIRMPTVLCSWTYIASARQFVPGCKHVQLAKLCFGNALSH